MARRLLIVDRRTRKLHGGHPCARRCSASHCSCCHRRLQEDRRERIPGEDARRRRERRRTPSRLRTSTSAPRRTRSTPRSSARQKDTLDRRQAGRRHQEDGSQDADGRREEAVGRRDGAPSSVDGFRFDGRHAGTLGWSPRPAVYRSPTHRLTAHAMPAPLAPSISAPTPSPALPPPCAARWPRPRSATTCSTAIRRCAGWRRASRHCSARKRGSSSRAGRWRTRPRSGCTPTPGTEVLLDANAHIIHWEMAGAAALCGVQVRAVLAGDGRLVCVRRRPASGRCGRRRSHAPVASARLRREHAQRRGRQGDAARRSSRRSGRWPTRTRLPVHMDGARLWNASRRVGHAARATSHAALTRSCSASPRGSAVRSARSSSATSARSGARTWCGSGWAAACGRAASSPPPRCTRWTRTSSGSPRTTRTRALSPRRSRAPPGRSVVAPDTNIVMVDLPNAVASTAVVAAAAEQGVLHLAVERDARARRDAPRRGCRRPSRAAEPCVARRDRAARRRLTTASLRAPSRLSFGCPRSRRAAAF